MSEIICFPACHMEGNRWYPYNRTLFYRSGNAAIKFSSTPRGAEKSLFIDLRHLFWSIDGIIHHTG